MRTIADGRRLITPTDSAAAVERAAADLAEQERRRRYTTAHPG
jgi:hypothetical protein